MKMPPFAYRRADSLAALFDLWHAAGPEARLLAGGQSLLASLAFRLSEPPMLIDITRIAALRGITAADGVLRLGALTTHAAIARDTLVARHAPLLAEAAPLIAHAAIRNRGTLGGSLAYADPAAEWPAVMVALGATIVVASAGGERRIAARDFFRGGFATALAPFEVITAVDMPVAREDDRATIIEVARRSGDYAMAGLVVAARIGAGRLRDVRIVGFALGDGPVVASRAAATLEGSAGDPAAIATAQSALIAELDPPRDLNGSPATRRHMASVLLGRAIARISGAGEAKAA
jgi:carbon-monoxide dehydrogenase medium subunit